MAIFRSTLRTIQIVNVRWFNATAWYGMELARLLNNAGHRTLTLGLGGTLSFEQARKMDLDPIALPLTSNNPAVLARLTRDLRRLIQDFNPDVINCHRGESFLLFGLLKKWGNYTLVRTRGDQRLPKNNLPNRLLHQRAADAVIATNSVMARYFVETLHLEPGHVHTILGGVDTARFHFDAAGREEVRARYGFRPEHQVIGLLGRFDRVKGQKELIEAAAALIRDGHPNVRLLLLGFATATSREEVERWIQDAGMREFTVISGKVEDVPAHISALDVGVVASLWSETIARAALEIMACRRPLISTSVGVMPDLLPQEALCAPGDVPALTALLRRALAETGSYREMLLQAQETRMRDLDSAHFLEKTLHVYERALSARR